MEKEDTKLMKLEKMDKDDYPEELSSTSFLSTAHKA
jgi:hypothetical protein